MAEVNDQINNLHNSALKKITFRDNEKKNSNGTERG